MKGWEEERDWTSKKRIHRDCFDKIQADRERANKTFY